MRFMGFPGHTDPPSLSHGLESQRVTWGTSNKDSYRPAGSQTLHRALGVPTEYSQQPLSPVLFDPQLVGKETERYREPR